MAVQRWYGSPNGNTVTTLIHDGNQELANKCKPCKNLKN